MSEIVVLPEKMITPSEFEAVFKPLYGFHFPLAKKLFMEYGSLLSFSSSSVMLYAYEAGTKKECLRKMRGHLNNVLGMCHPELRRHPVFHDHPTYMKTCIFLVGLVRELNPGLVKPQKNADFSI